MADMGNNYLENRIDLITIIGNVMTSVYQIKDKMFIIVARI